MDFNETDCDGTECDKPDSSQINRDEMGDEQIKPEPDSFSEFQPQESFQETASTNSTYRNMKIASSLYEQSSLRLRPKFEAHTIELPFRGVAPERPPEQRLESTQRAHNNVRQRPFNLFEALLQQDEILLYLSTRMLPPRDLLNLYSISKGFHYKVNLSQSAYILSCARAWISVDDPCPVAPLSVNILPNFLTTNKADPRHADKSLTAPQVLPFGPFQRFCHRDPTDRRVEETISPRVMQALLFNEPGRGVPDFRYLFFLISEVAAASSIIRMLWTDYGLILPADSLRTMGKLALLMNARRNSARISIIHNVAWFTDADIFRANTIFMKLDMAFTDPLQRLRTAVRKTTTLRMRATESGRGMRQLVSAQPGWTVCARILARHDGYTSTQDFMRLWTEWMFVPRQNFRNSPAWGLKPQQMGRLGSEEFRDEYGHRYRGERKLASVEELVTREGARRRLGMQKWLIETMACGFVDPLTGETLDGPSECNDTDCPTS